MKLQIKSPCQQNWEKMKIRLHSRFCENCQKNVIDFTGKNRQEILEYLISNYDKKNCGRFYPSQLDITHSDILVTIKSLSKGHKNTNLQFYLLTLGTLILAGCNNAQNVDKFNSLHVNYPESSANPPKSSMDGSFHQPEVEKLSDTESVLTGEVDIRGHQFPDSNNIYTMPEIMPEFHGGIDSLKVYIKNNLQYPEWEQKNKIEGTIYVSFIVEKTGKIREAKIIRTVKDSKNFDAEVLRVVNAMPNWKPGMQEGKQVDVRFNLPVRFKL